MISIPRDFLDPAELVSAVGRSEKDLEISITGMEIEKSSMTLNVSMKLNFMMPMKIERSMKQAFVSRFEDIENVSFSYIFADNGERARIEQNYSNAAQNANAASNEGSRVRTAGNGKSWPERGNASKKIGTVEPGETVFGKPVTREPVKIAEIYETVGSKGDKSVEGRIFDKSSNPLKNGKSTILILLINDNVRSLCVKCFVDNDEFKAVDAALNIGDDIRTLGHAEFDNYENEIVFRAKSIDRIKVEGKVDNHEGPKRVELHCHTKMSDNDGFNEIKDLITTAAKWGQPAIAITDHGVVQAFPEAMQTQKALRKKGMDIKVLYGMEGYLYDDAGCIRDDGTIDYKKKGTYHIILIAKNQQGIKDLYKLVSTSHLDYFYHRPRLPRSILAKYRDNLIIGSACEAGEVYRSVRNGLPHDELLRIASFYDYLEIQPLGNNQFLVDEGYVSSVQDLIDINLRIVGLADELGKLTVATTDSHYPTPEAAIYRNIIMAGMGFNETKSNSLYLRTTDEMLSEFEYLGDRAEEIVITNTNKIAEMVDDGIKPLSDQKCPPILHNSDERLRTSCLAKAKEIYGDPLPDWIEERLNTEMNAIIANGYAVMYVSAQMLVQKSLSDGYLVGSRGSVGSSFVATMAGITEVNPLRPHYICPKCKHLELPSEDEANKYDVGFDMPDMFCPECGTLMKKDGLNIPFATFLGFDGDKEPDIDLNFAGEYQPVAHEYVSEIFGEHNTIFKAGTVSTIESKTAYGHVMHYIEDTGYPANKFDVEFLTKGCTGVKRTTGQHPGGMIIVPGDHEIYDFCPVQRPANKSDSNMITTHFDYHKIEANLLKLDILGHNVPQMIRHLQLMTGVDPLTIPLDDKKTLSIFTSMDALDIKNPDYRFRHGTYGIPEFGTGPTRAMLDDIKPTTMSMLIKISGFAHGTDVWANNVQDLLRSGTATMDEVISSRDDIMNFLISKGVNNSDSFKIMEVVRKSKRELNENEIMIMKEHGIPDWYIWSCNTLKYLFPRAHASAYVMMAVRMAWYKVYYPAAFYAAWFSSKIEDFDIEAVKDGMESLEPAMAELERLGKNTTKKQEDRMIVYEVMYEMFSRGIEFAMPELGISKPTAFCVTDGKVRIPFRGVSGIGVQAAESLDEAYKKRAFTSLDDVRKGTKLSNTNIDELKKYGMFAGLPESDQISIFDL